MVISELYKARYNQSLDSNLFFFRDNNGNEVDVLFKKGHQLIPIEIKAASTFNPKFIKSIEYFKKISSGSDFGYVIYNGERSIEYNGTKVINYSNSSSIVKSRR
jgi:hypothetical protein